MATRTRQASNKDTDEPMEARPTRAKSSSRAKRASTAADNAPMTETAKPRRPRRVAATKKPSTAEVVQDGQDADGAPPRQDDQELAPSPWKSFDETPAQTAQLIGEATSKKMANSAYFCLRVYQTKTKKYNAQLALMDSTDDAVLWQTKTTTAKFDTTLDKIEDFKIEPGLDLYSERCSGQGSNAGAMADFFKQAQRAEAKAVYDDLIGAFLYEIVAVDAGEHHSVALHL